MKILIAASGFDSPRKHEVNIFALDQAKALRDAGHDVRFAAVDTRSIRHSRRGDVIDTRWTAYPFITLRFPAARCHWGFRSWPDGWRPPASVAP